MALASSQTKWKSRRLALRFVRFLTNLEKADLSPSQLAGSPRDSCDAVATAFSRKPNHPRGKPAGFQRCGGCSKESKESKRIKESKGHPSFVIDLIIVAIPLQNENLGTTGIAIQKVTVFG